MSIRGPSPPPRSVALQECEDVSAPLGGLFEGGPVAAVVEEHEARDGDAVQDRDRDLERQEKFAGRPCRSAGPAFGRPEDKRSHRYLWQKWTPAFRRR